MIRKRPGQIVRGRRGTVLGGKSEQTFGVPINLGGTIAPRESLEQYWHPNRAGVEMAPADFLQKLKDMNPDLSCCRPPGNAPVKHGSAWLFWYKRDRITHHLCPGWMLLFSWRSDDGVPQPLDERCFAVLYGASALKHGDGATYFKRCVEEKMADAAAARDREFQNHRHAKQREFVRSTKISTAGNGSKFARHHDGTLQPSRSQLNWHIENRRRLLPSEMIQAEDEMQERARAHAADLVKEARKLG